MPQPLCHSWGLRGARLFLLQMNRAGFSQDSWKEVDCRMVLGRDKSRLEMHGEGIQTDITCERHFHICSQ